MKNLQKPLKIGNVVLPSNIILAPMAGYTDLAFRQMCCEFGAGLVCTEMVSSKALSYKNKKTEDLLLSLPQTKPSAVQIFGHEPKIMAEAVQNPLLDKFDIIDINMGCPATKITKNGDGSALLKNFDLAKQIIKACVGATEKPITVKFRIGYNDGEDIATEFAKMCEEAGASAITVHGRTTKQGYSGKANYEAIKRVKEAVNIPVFANGDCKSKEDYFNIIRQTNADGVMIGRGALGCPEIFAELSAKEISSIDKFSQIKYHYETLLKFYSEKLVVMNMRAHLAYYLKGKYKNSQTLLNLLKCTTYADVLAILNDFFTQTPKI